MENKDKKNLDDFLKKDVPNLDSLKKKYFEGSRISS